MHMFPRQQTLLAIISLVVAWKVPGGIRTTILLAVIQLESVMNNRSNFDEGETWSMGGLCIQPRTVESSNFSSKLSSIYCTIEAQMVQFYGSSQISESYKR